jgi:hypothetical protein
MRLLSSAILLSAFAGVASAQTSQVVEAGRYLVTVAYTDECSPSALDLSKSWTYAAAAFEGAERDVADVAVAGPVLDNVIRAAVCRSGDSVGTLVVAAQAETELKVADADSERQDVRIGVESVDSVKSVAKNKTRVTLPAGEYLVDFLGFDGCNGGSEVNVVRELEVSFTAAADKLTFKTNGYVSDNWIRPAVCVAGPLTGSAYVQVAKKTTVVAPQGFKLSAARIVAKSPL